MLTTKDVDHERCGYRKSHTADTRSKDGGGCKVPIRARTDQDDNEDQAEREGGKTRLATGHTWLRGYPDIWL
jgi:hypothetical protein